MVWRCLAAWSGLLAGQSFFGAKDARDANEAADFNPYISDCLIWIA